MRKCYFSGQKHIGTSPLISFPFSWIQVPECCRPRKTPGKWDMSPKCHQTTGEPTTQGIILNMLLVEYMTYDSHRGNLHKNGVVPLDQKKNSRRSATTPCRVWDVLGGSSRKCKTVCSIVFQHSSRKWRREIGAVPVSFTTIFHPQW